MAASTNHVRVAIIGSGFGGLGTAIRLKQSGIDDFIVFERADELGGTWQVNTYPSAQCDIPSMLYSFSFAPNPEWTRLYPLQPKIKAYLHKCADDFGVTPHVRLEHTVESASWDDESTVWRICTTGGDWTADVLVGAIGPFSEPAVPNLPGLEDFEGTSFHSASWNHAHDLAGQRVAIIGTGASAVQFIPKVQQVAGHVTVFQRTPTWILPHPDRPLSKRTRAFLRKVPAAQKAGRKLLDLGQESLVPGFVHKPSLLKGMAAVGRWHLKRQVSDPELRADLSPTYQVGCKRPTFSNAYYPALAAPNVDVVTSGIREVTATAVVTQDGTHHEVDTIIFGTGFRISDHPGFHAVKGRDGTTLGDVWAGGEMAAHLGTTVSGFPNFFMILGPNSVVYTSQVVTIEAQVQYVLDALQAMDRHGIASIDVRPEVQQKFIDDTDHALRNSVWNSGGCSSYYLSPKGRNVTFWPGFNWQFRRRTRHIDLTEYIARPRTTQANA